MEPLDIVNERIYDIYHKEEKVEDRSGYITRA